MAILLNDDLLSFAEARNNCPNAATASPRTRFTLARWAQDGFRNVRLEVLRIGKSFSPPAPRCNAFRGDDPT